MAFQRGPISKIRPSDGCRRVAVPLAVESWYNFHGFGCHLGNVGSRKRARRHANGGTGWPGNRPAIRASPNRTVNNPRSTSPRRGDSANELHRNRRFRAPGWRHRVPNGTEPRNPMSNGTARASRLSCDHVGKGSGDPRRHGGRKRLRARVLASMMAWWSRWRWRFGGPGCRRQGGRWPHEHDRASLAYCSGTTGLALGLLLRGSCRLNQVNLLRHFQCLQIDLVTPFSVKSGTSLSRNLMFSPAACSVMTTFAPRGALLYTIGRHASPPRAAFQALRR